MSLLDTFAGLFAYPIEQRQTHHDGHGNEIQTLDQIPSVNHTMAVRARTGRQLSDQQLDRLAVIVCGRTHDGKTAADLGMTPRRAPRRNPLGGWMY